MSDGDRATWCETISSLLMYGGLVLLSVLCLSAFLEYKESDWGTYDELTEEGKSDCNYLCVMSEFVNWDEFVGWYEQLTEEEKSD